jgi:hypothetical protein
MSENGFAAPADADEGFGADAPVAVGEGDSKAPRANFERNPLKVLATLANKPLKQATKAIEYLDSYDDRKRKVLKALSPEALEYVAKEGPEYLSAVQAISN